MIWKPIKEKLNQYSKKTQNLKTIQDKKNKKLGSSRKLKML